MAGVEALTTTELCRSMRERGIDEETVEMLEGGDIDGQTLVLLVEDYTEFSGLVPKPGPRLKIKKYLQQFTPSVPVAAQSSSIKTSSDTCNGQSCGELSDSDSSFSETSPEPSSRKRNRASSADIDESIDLTKVNQPQKKVKAIEEDITEAPTFNKENVQPNTCNLANIPLPTRFSFRVQKAIERGELAEKEIRLAFVRDCVDYFQPLLPNPGREGYSEIAKKLCDTYPCLKDRRTSNYWKTLSSQLSQRYRNSRRPSRKVTDQKLCHQCEVSVDATNTPSLQNSSAERERDEENVQALKKLVQGKAAPTQVVQTLLDATRPQRKVYLERVDISVRDILEVYPVFRIPKWVLYEFCKLLEGEDAKATIMSSWQKTCDKLKSLSSVSSEEESEFERDMLVFKIIERNIYNKKPSIHPVSFIKAGEDLESHFTSEMMEPRLLVFHDDQDIVQMFVVAENEALLELSCVSLVEGFVYLIATYYIFNVSYPNYCKPTLYFLQDVLLARPDANIRRPVRYSSFLSRHGL